MTFQSRWACPECKSTNVQISLPTWYKESINPSDELVLVDTDTEADVMFWYCPDCDESGLGQPVDTTAQAIVDYMMQAGALRPTKPGDPA